MDGIKTPKGITFYNSEDYFIQFVGHFDSEETFPVQKKGLHDPLDYLNLKGRLSFFAKNRSHGFRVGTEEVTIISAWIHLERSSFDCCSKKYLFTRALVSR